MRILALTLVALALAHAAAPAGAAAQARASMPACDVAERSATFQGDMRARPDAARMQMRFVLRTRVSRRWARVDADGFGEWQTADPGVLRYVYTKTVENLPAPGAYRAKVVFRWLDADGEPVARRRRRTPICRQPDPRPDLRALAVEARPGGWAVVVRNGGRSAAGAFEVAATDGDGEQVREVAGLEAGERTLVTFRGACRGGVRIVLDPADAVDERDEDDNVLEAPCPA